MPALPAWTAADHVAAFALVLPRADPPADVLRDLGRLHDDLAGYPLPRQLDALLALTTLEHLHYGSDWPFTPDVVVEHAATALAGSGSLLDRLALNTAALFPDLDRHGAPARRPR